MLEKDNEIDQKLIAKKYGLNKKQIDRYLPKPRVIYLPRKHRRYATYLRLWKESDVVAALSNPELKLELERYQEMKREEALKGEVAAMLMEYTPDSIISKGSGLARYFVLHVGPTNSGKTHDSIQALITQRNGCYLGPLRLLALEMFDRINAAGVPCSLLTGEESIPVENAEIVSSTVELCDFSRRFKVAVIDEAQLITDEDRGSAWLRAICLVNADEVHICLAPEALDYIEALIKEFGDPYTVVRHQRLVPLEYKGHCSGYKDIRPNDAIICFSRKNVLSTAALLERNGFKASVIYGALPPQARRNEVEKYTSGKTNVVVSTDAIGMGVTLPIKRVIFAETYKFNGKELVPLTPSEIRQIAGRAGRYGMFDLGEVLTMDKSDIIEKGLKYGAKQIKAPCFSFPREALSTKYPIDILLKTWKSLPPSGAFKREDVSDSLSLYSLIREQAKKADRNLVYDLISCPIDIRSQDLVYYWANCARRILSGRHIPEPYFETDTLQGCELQYKAYDVHHQLLTRIGKEDDSTAQRDEICEKIRQLMAEDKTEYIRKCKRCGKELPIGYPFNLCQRCYKQ